MADYDVKAVCEERQRALWPTSMRVFSLPKHTSDGQFCICEQLQTAHDAGKVAGVDACIAIAKTEIRGEDDGT